MTDSQLVVTSAEGPRQATALLVDDLGDLRAATLDVLPAGYTSVAAMLAGGPFHVAHRGGSGDWAEMTLRAYTNATAWGVGALEVSLNRTLDGVWFGLHDQTLDRTSGTTGADPTTMTWAQVNAHLVFGAEPYMPWEQLVAAYAGTHVLLVDPKYRQSSHRTEFLDMLDHAGGPDRIIVKYYGDNMALAAAAAARGYSRWGYYYAGDVTSGVLAASQGAWDILGMDHGAPTEAWSAATSYGKPVIGHIVADPTQAASALAKGAAGLVVSGVTTVVSPALPWT